MIYNFFFSWIFLFPFDFKNIQWKFEWLNKNISKLTQCCKAFVQVKMSWQGVNSWNGKYIYVHIEGKDEMKEKGWQEGVDPIVNTKSVVHRVAALGLFLALSLSLSHSFLFPTLFRAFTLFSLLPLLVAAPPGLLIVSDSRMSNRANVVFNVNLDRRQVVSSSSLSDFCEVQQLYPLYQLVY